LAKPIRQILVCLNQRPEDNPKGSCAQKGAEELLNTIKKTIAERGLKEQVMVTGTRCLKHCSQGNTVALQPENVWYAKVTPGDVAEICDAHLHGAAVVERLLMPDIPWE
jgi:(2Fe-2S) ferredoxin